MMSLPHLATDNERLQRLVRFARNIAMVCEAAGVSPVLDGSLAVLAHTQDPTIPFRDVDYGCPDDALPRLQDALEAHGYACDLKPWRVLQARDGDLKADLGAEERWSAGLHGPHDLLNLEGYHVRMLNLVDLRELYRRGCEALHDVEGQRDKYAETLGKLHALDRAIRPSSSDGKPGGRQG